MLFEQINRKKVVITKCGQLPHENSVVLVDCQLCSSFLLTYQNLALWTCQNLVWVYFRTVRTMTFNIMSQLRWKPEKKVLPCSQGTRASRELAFQEVKFIHSFKLDIIIHVLQGADGLPFAIHHRDNTETDNHSLSYSLLLRLWNHQLT